MLVLGDAPHRYSRFFQPMGGKKVAPASPGSFVVIARQLGPDVYYINNDWPGLESLTASPDLCTIGCRS